MDYIMLRCVERQRWFASLVMAGHAFMNPSPECYSVYTYLFYCGGFEKENMQIQEKFIDEIRTLGLRALFCRSTYSSIPNSMENCGTWPKFPAGGGAKMT
ncbi:hypothetical protein Y032_0005g2530 [Ancylostoma ceylanicum]|uniref:Uncharacterized protein n=1 Tax=Ancylostoma ceylanicum TaxID=53326 RepID=A0A016VRN0_9BILA|nr:hypothetical protein Y032_0005g2530 [Ancylostoma ceylanicum]